MSVEAIVSWREGCPHRERIWEWLRPRWRWDVREALAPEGEWVKAAALQPALEESDAEIVIVADADVMCEGITSAIKAVRAGMPWAIPHRLVKRLSESGTAALLDGREWAGFDWDRKPYQGVEGGGVLVAKRELLVEVPLDRRFIGWGSEDESWALALRCLAGEPWRGNADLFHLWHPSQPRISRRRGSTASWALRREYLKAREDPDEMRALVASSLQSSA